MEEFLEIISGGAQFFLDRGSNPSHLRSSQTSWPSPHLQCYTAIHKLKFLIEILNIILKYMAFKIP